LFGRSRCTQLDLWQHVLLVEAAGRCAKTLAEIDSALGSIR